MADSKGISLRRKKTTRPTISAPRQIQTRPRESSIDSRAQSLWETQTTASGNTNLSVPGVGRLGDKTSDLVKRRYSTRFVGGVGQSGFDGGLTPPVPAIPTLPAQFANGARGVAGGRERSTSPSGHGRSPSPSGRLKVDVRALKDPNLQPDQFVHNVLADATEADILAYQNQLQQVKGHASNDLQHNVYQNRTQFVRISKEADKLRSEMRTLRTLMGDLTSALGHATSAGSSEMSNGIVGMSLADRKRANRSSVANLEAMWSTHLQTLWKRVEGSQKYLPALPGRHIIMESQRWVELNAATWKPKRRIALVLLNDHLLVASEKKRAVDLNSANGEGDGSKNKRQTIYNNPNPPQTTLVAERCWPLAEVRLADISTTSAASVGHKENSVMQNALNIRAGNESLTYATSDSAEKAGLLVAFRKAQEDLRKLVAAEHGERERALDELALLTGRDPRLLKRAAADANEAAGGLNRSNSVLVDADGRQQNIRWVEAQIDALDIDIALQRFEDAVARVEKLRKLAKSIRSNATASEIIQAKVNERATRLANSVARQVVLTSAGTARTKENVSWLLRLGFEELARTKYLDSRTTNLRFRARQIPFTGPLPPYLHALSYITFASLLHTIQTFNSAFPASSSSAVVKWAKERVEEFNAHLERQLSNIERGTDLWKECIRVVKGQAGVLNAVGVDFRGLVARGLAVDDIRSPGKGRQRDRERRKAGPSEGIGLGVSTG